MVGDNKGDEESRLRAKRSLYGSPGLTIGSFRALSKVGGLPHDDMDDGDFACPFAVDDDEVDEYRSRYLIVAFKNPSLCMNSGTTVDC